MPDQSPPIPRAWLSLALLFCAVCFNYIARVMVTTMHGSIVAEIPLTEAQFGLLTSVFLWIYGALQPLAGFIGDRFSRSRVLIISTIGWSVLTLLTAYARNFDQFLVMRVLMGVSESVYMPTACALLADYHRGPTRSLAQGVHLAGALLGSSLGGLGGWLAELRSWHYAFALIGLASLAFSILLVFTLRDAPREGAGQGFPQAIEPAPGLRLSIASLLRRRAFVFVLVFFFLYGSTGWMIIGWTPLFVQRQFHLHQGAAGLSATGYLNFAGLLGVLIGGGWADRWAKKNIRGRIYVPIVGLLAAAPGIWLLTHTGSFSLAMLGLSLYGLFGPFAPTNLMPILCLIADPRCRATAYGVVTFGNTIGGGAAIFLAGALMDRHVPLERILSSASAGLVAAALMLFLVKTPASTPS